MGRCTDKIATTRMRTNSKPQGSKIKKTTIRKTKEVRELKKQITIKMINMSKNDKV